MEMIRHQHDEFGPPFMKVSIALNGVLDRVCRLILCETVCASLLAVDRYEINFTVVDPERNAVLEPFSCEI